MDDVTFVKVGKNYLNPNKVERFLVIDDEIYLSTNSGREHSLVRDESEDIDTAMQKIVRRTSERAHDIIYLDAFAQNSENMLSEDQASNLLYRQWLEHKTKK